MTTELDIQMQETARILRRLDEKLGGFMEGMAFPSMQKILKERFEVNIVYPRTRSSQNGRILELDVLADSTVNCSAYVVAVKRHLQEEGTFMSSPSPASSVRRGQLFVAGAAVLYGTVTVGGSFFHQSGLSLYELSLYPLVLTHLMLLPALVRDARYAIRREMIWFFVVYGLIGALAELSQFAGIVLGVPVATVSLLLYLQPIWTGLFGRMMLKERITGRKIVAMALAVSGALVLVTSDSLKGANGKGIAFAVLGGVFIALWVIWGRRSGINQAGVILLLEPVSASLLATLLFGQPLGPSTIAGGGLILLSNFLLTEAS